MPRYKILIEYDGAPFAGWQFQENVASVQRTIMEAVEAFSGEKVMVQGAGRTDAGVHALGQVGHFDLAADRPTDTIRDALNAYLRPHPVAILSAEKVPANFDARRSAVRRHYLYRIANRRPDLALERGRAWRVPRRLDAEAMHAAAQRLVGKHDFTTFRSTECQAKSPDKTLDAIRDHGKPALNLALGLGEANTQLDELAKLGIDMDSVGETLQADGVKQFASAFDKLLALVA